MSSSGKLCCGPSESSTQSSLAAACSSKSKVAQKRLRRASPNARFTLPPKGACSTSCMPPLSSKKRSSTMCSRVGTTPERRASCREVAHHHRRHVVVDAGTLLDPRDRLVGTALGEQRVDPTAQIRHLLATAPRCAPAPHRARTAPTAARRAHRRPAPCLPPRGGSSTTCCRAGRCHPPTIRWPSPRSPFR